MCEMLSHVACGCVSNFCYALEVYFPRTNGALVVGESIRVVHKSIDNIKLEKSSNVEKSSSTVGVGGWSVHTTSVAVQQ